MANECSHLLTSNKNVAMDSFPSGSTSTSPVPMLAINHDHAPTDDMVTMPPPLSSRTHLQVPQSANVRESLLSDFENSITSQNLRAVLVALERAVDLLRGQVAVEEEQEAERRR